MAKWRATLESRVVALLPPLQDNHRNGMPSHDTTSTVLTAFAEHARRKINGDLDDTRSHLGQFMTPGPIARFMAGMFRTRRSSVRILDPGAGVGALTAALVERLLERAPLPQTISAVCYEVDVRLASALTGTLLACRDRCAGLGVEFNFAVRSEDYIAAQAQEARGLFGRQPVTYDCVITNPPYRKINSTSDTRQQLRAMGIETTNLYAAFMLLAARQLAPRGEFVSISPRSFCNGSYFLPFRRELLQLLDVRHLHVFESRTAAFSEDGVLQENIVLYATRNEGQGRAVRISVTDTAGKVSARTVKADQVVHHNDVESIIHVSADAQTGDVSKRIKSLPAMLGDLGLSVSTGRVVDFRAKDYLRSQPAPDTVPLVYAAHFGDGFIVWPNATTRKPNAIVNCPATVPLLVPRGYYVLTKRFSAKEEPRRIVAALYDPTKVEAEHAGFDNKTNYYHLRGTGMDEAMARGLVVFLNSSIVDSYFRSFSGHTQVNAGDLRRLSYPSASQLRELGQLPKLADQSLVDEAVSRLF